MTENEMVGWHQQLDGHEFEKAPGVGDEQGSLASCSPWGCKELDTTEQLDKLLLPCCSIPSSSAGAGKPLPCSHHTLGTQSPGKMVHLVYLQSLSISLPFSP